MLLLQRTKCCCCEEGDKNGSIKEEVVSPINGNGVELTLLKEERLIFRLEPKKSNIKSFQFEIQSANKID